MDRPQESRGVAPAIDAPVVADRELLEEEESAVAFLARLRVAGETGRIPSDVAAWAIEVCAEHVPALARQQARNRHLRTAANLLSGGSWARARRLEHEVLAARGQRPRRSRVRPQEATVAYHVRQALAIDPDTPTSARHLFRVLTG